MHTICATVTMAEDNGKVDATQMETKRVRKQSEKSFEEKLHSLIKSRRGVLSLITYKKNEIESLMKNPINVVKVKRTMRELSNVIFHFKDLTAQIGELCPEEKNADYESWYKLSDINTFVDDTSA